MIAFTPWEYVIILFVFGWPLYAAIAGLATWVRMSPARFSQRMRTTAGVFQLIFIPAFILALWAWTSFEFFDPEGKFYDALHRRTLTQAETIEGVQIPAGAVVHYRYGRASWVDFVTPTTFGGLRLIHASGGFPAGFQWMFYDDMRVDVSSQDTLVADGCAFKKVESNGQTYLLMQVGQPQQCVRALNAAAQGESK